MVLLLDRFDENVQSGIRSCDPQTRNNLSDATLSCTMSLVGTRLPLYRTFLVVEWSLKTLV